MDNKTLLAHLNTLRQFTFDAPVTMQQWEKFGYVHGYNKALDDIHQVLTEKQTTFKFQPPAVSSCQTSKCSITSNNTTPNKYSYLGLC